MKLEALRVNVNNLNSFVVSSFMPGENLSVDVSVAMRDIPLEEYSLLHKLMFEKNVKISIVFEREVGDESLQGKD